MNLKSYVFLNTKMMSVFLKKQKKVRMQNFIGEIKNEYIEEEKEEHEKNKVLEKKPTHYEAFEYVSALENYFLIHNPENLTLIFDLKKSLNNKNTERGHDIFDFFKKT
ncbi:hypothetical protein DMUE_3830 [Dictyocoela muelleri]|nr:hypothetical protein DMUE_3830 [Dictyocoela muelleri]